MRLGAWLCVLVAGLGLGGASSACSGGYPLPATPCDEWCDATQGFDCFSSYEPAGCVSACEQSHTGDAACSALLRAAITCYRKNPDALSKQCTLLSYGGPPENIPCLAENELLSQCTGSLFQTQAPSE